jgi:hypothetical protein
MPTIAELIKAATKTEYEVSGAKVTIERRPRAEAGIKSTAVAVDKKAGRDEYFRLRDCVWKTLRFVLKEYEDFQRYLKKELKGPQSHTRLYRKMVAHKAIENTTTLKMLYRLIEFTRIGTKVDGAAETEDFFNKFFTGKIEFKNAYWTYWNKKHNKTKTAEKPAVKVATTKVETSSDKKPYHCPNCNTFVSRKTNYCSRCKTTVSPR